MKCALDVDPGNESVQVGNRAMNGEFITGDPTDGGEVDLSNYFDLDERYSGQCPPDPVFSVWGRTISVPMSEACKWLGILGDAAVAVCCLAGARIIFGS